MSCDNCKQLERRIEELRLEVLEIEQRRSREKTRFVERLNKQFQARLRDQNELDPHFKPSREDFIVLLQLLNRVVEDPSREHLEKTKAQLEKYVL